MIFRIRRKIRMNYSNDFLYMFNLSKRVNLVTPLIDVQIRSMNLRDELFNLILTRKIRDMYRVFKYIIRLMLRGEIVYNAIYNHKIVSRGIIDFGGPRINTQKHEIAIVECETDANYRGNKLYPAILTRILKTYKAKGYKIMYMWTSKDNIASQKGIERAGFKRIKDRKLFSRLFRLRI